ncbi:hypothetical protein GJ496_010861 [Pomphorhynchus laevis]|nr:hypothetical protein GJ496_010861 [Pomphorhynchus laevis]
MKQSNDSFTLDDEIEALCVYNFSYLICGLINGGIQWCDIEKNAINSAANISRASIRCIQVEDDVLFAGTSRGLIKAIDLRTNQLSHKLRRKGTDATNGINCMATFNNRYISSGDDSGCISVWDLRSTKQAFLTIKECDDFISDMTVDERKHTLLATSGEGTLTAIKYKQGKVQMQSELFDSELLCLSYVKDKTKIVCGSGDGVMYLFNENEYGNMSDRFPVCKYSIDCVELLNEDRLLLGCGDGQIRLINVLPNQNVGIIGPNLQVPIHSLKVIGNVVAVACYDKTLHFINVPKYKNFANIDSTFFADLELE